MNFAIMLYTQVDRLIVHESRLKCPNGSLTILLRVNRVESH